jgi:MerR family transcriptional regulator, thiopeptide resistance regulator
MARGRSYQVKEVADLSGVSVRALHPYDAIGLLVPQGRTDAGYRLYAEQDLLRLQQILIGRELGLSLEEIRCSLDDASFDRKGMLVRQRAELAKRVQQATAMLGAVERALALIEGETMDIKQIFDGFEPAKYEAEAERRWGDSEAFKESKRRTQRYTPEDWQRLAAEQASVYGDAYQALLAGKLPSDPEVLDVAERHRQSIDRWFYPCSFAMHRGLAALYEQDHRFAENIDKNRPGLTPFLVAAIRENARKHGG